MNKQFFKGMQKFASALLIIGVCGSILMLFLLSVTEISTGAYTTKQVFNPTGFASSISCLFGAIAGYYLLKGVALIGIKTYGEEPDVEPKPAPPQEPPVVTEEQLLNAAKQKRVAIWTTVGLIVLVLVLVALAYFNKS